MSFRGFKPDRQGQRGVPAALVILLSVLALLLGAAFGYILKERFATKGPAEGAATETIAPEGEEEIDPETSALTQAEAVRLLSGDIDAAALSGGGQDLRVAAEEELGALPEEPVVVAEFDGGTVLSSEVVDAYNEVVNTYLLLGIPVSDNASELLDAALESAVTRRVAYEKAQELGLTELTTADKATAEAEAQETFDILVDAQMDVGEGANEAEARATAIEQLAADGITLKSIEEQLQNDMWNVKLYAHITDGVALSEADVRQAYDALVAEQKGVFDEFTDDYEYAHLNGELVAYNPTGYRAVKHIFFSMSEEELARCVALMEERAELDSEADAARIAAIDEELNALYAPLEERAKEAAGRLERGEAFDALMAELGEDELMREGAIVESGYYVCEDTALWSEDFVRAAMALRSIGEVSRPVRSVGGVHLIEYVADVPAGATPLAEIRAEVEEMALEHALQEAYEAQIAEWLEEAHATYYPERLQE